MKFSSVLLGLVSVGIKLASAQIPAGNATVTASSTADVPIQSVVQLQQPPKGPKPSNTRVIIAHQTAATNVKVQKLAPSLAENVHSSSFTSLPTTVLQSTTTAVTSVAAASTVQPTALLNTTPTPNTPSVQKNSTISENHQNTKDDPIFNQFITEMAGVYTLIAFAIFVLSFLFLVVTVRYFKAKGKMNPVHAGALRYCAAQGNVAALELLAKQPNFDVNSCHDGFTALHAASVSGQARAVEWLLKNGADVTLKKNDEWNDTALHYAAGKGHAEVVSLLLKNGATQEKNFAGQLPIDLAKENNHHKVLKVFNEFANPDSVANEVVHENHEGFYIADSESSDGYASSVSSKQNLEIDESDLSWVLERRWDNAGTPDTKIYAKTALTKFFVISSIFITMIYIFWRACRTINPDHVGYSVFIYVCELFLTLQFLLSLVLMWAPITRPDRDLYKMVGESEFPSVDIYVVTYNEDEEIVDATVCAAANLNYPKKKINIFVLDDGKRANIKAMSDRIQSELESIGSRVKITYCARPKVKGVNHHAKAGNINHCFTKLPQSKGDYVLILDCDMIVTKSFLLKTIPHFFELKNGKYVRKEKAAMLQIPQRFYNLGKNDPWWHTAEDFNAAGFEGSDGVGGTPCVGTGVLFRRECLLSLGGQSYWSVTEDFKTSFNLIGEGFSTMYLFRNLVFGIAVDDVVGIYKQRLRWSTGGLQILQYDNPLFKVGLPWAATSLFFCNAWQYVLCIPYLAVTIAPLVYFILGVSPVYTLLLETSIFVGGFILVTRCLQWWQVRLIQGSKDMALWRGCQQIVWLAPIFFHSLCQMIWLKTGKRVIEFIQRKTSHVEFVTSRKDGAKMPVTEILKANWFPL
ncbi:hypothetical protein HDV06_001815, partial [Boothiomyces sp. JEL0866]